jgi:hypothetical protein
MKHELKPLAYLRYGDDWLCFAEGSEAIELIRLSSIEFLHKELSLTVNPKIDCASKVHKGVSYLGVDIWPNGTRLQPSVQKRIQDRITLQNAASYRSLVFSYQKTRRLKELDWHLIDQSFN